MNIHLASDFGRCRSISDDFSFCGLSFRYVLFASKFMALVHSVASVRPSTMQCVLQGQVTVWRLVYLLTDVYVLVT